MSYFAATRFLYWALFPLVYCPWFASARVSPARALDIECEEARIGVTAKRELFSERRLPFAGRCVRLGVNGAAGKSCRAERASSGAEMVIRAGLGESGTGSRVDGDWLVYYNQLVLCPALVPSPDGRVVFRGPPAVIPVECHYKRRRTVSGHPLTPTWLPMTATVGASGLLRFSLRATTDDWSAQRTSSVYQRGEMIFLEASVEAPLHPPLRVYVDHCVATPNSDPLTSPSYKFITNHGCLVDSLVVDSSSRFFPRKQDNKLHFSFQAFRFSQNSGDQIFISCQLRATLKQYSPNYLNKACFFHSPSFSWLATEGSGALCTCCGSGDCARQTTETTSRAQPETDKEEEVNAAIGPLHTLAPSHWKGQISVTR